MVTLFHGCALLQVRLAIIAGRAGGIKQLLSRQTGSRESSDPRDH